MQEVVGILIALAALFIGLAILGWAYGDFNRPQPPRGPGSPPA